MLRSRSRTTASRAAAAFAAALVALLAACTQSFQPRKFPTTLDLFKASVQQYDKHHWDNALAGFDLLASQLPARDTLLADVFWYQGQTHAKKDEHLLAAQAYSRILDAFPDDELADDALLRTGNEYRRLWRKPVLDAQYGQTALGTYRQLLDLYPDSKLVPEAAKNIAELNAMFADKDYRAGEFYFRNKAYDPAIIYYKDVVRLYPGTPAAYSSYLRLIAAYKVIKYKEETAETCTEARKFYPGDAEVSRSCADVAAAVATDTSAARRDTTRARIP